VTAVEFRKLTSSIGAVAINAKFTEVIGDPEAEASVRAGLWEHLMIAFPAQHLDDDSHEAVARIFGEPFVHPIGQAFGRTSPIEEIVDSADRLPDRDGWHTDAPFVDEPPSVAVLRALEVPDHGGDTLWANMYEAYDGLSDRMRSMFDGATVRYPPQQGLIDYVEEHLGKELADTVRELAGEGGTHPLVRTHPETGRKAIYYAEGFATEIVGLTKSENAAVRPFLCALPTNPSIQTRWNWSAGDVVIWDERATQHFGSADHSGSARTLRRIMVAGEVPN